MLITYMIPSYHKRVFSHQRVFSSNTDGVWSQENVFFCLYPSELAQSITSTFIVPLASKESVGSKSIICSQILVVYSEFNIDFATLSLYWSESKIPYAKNIPEVLVVEFDILELKGSVQLPISLMPYVFEEPTLLVLPVSLIEFNVE